MAILNWDNPECQKVNLGGKAARLRELSLAGFPVPAGFVLTGHDVEVNELAPYIESIGGFPVAVRSSGSLEDLEGASFAGLYETILNVTSLLDLVKAIKECFHSVESERVKSYLRQKGLQDKIASLQMNVLVQKMVPSEVAGVLFTLDPMSGKEEHCYSEMCLGLGERLVSGHVTPTRMVYDWKNQKIESLFLNDEKAQLTTSQITSLHNIALQIQAHYGLPQDIEWGTDQNGKVWILQTRPITSFRPRQDVPEMTDADLKEGGVSARVCTQMMFSLYREAFQKALSQYFQTIRLMPEASKINWMSLYYGRVYWNVGMAKEGLKRLIGFKEEDFDQDLGLTKEYGDEGPFHTKTNLTSLTRAMLIFPSLLLEFSKSLSESEIFKEIFELTDTDLRQKNLYVDKLGHEEFRLWCLDIIRFQRQTEEMYFRIISNNTNYQTIFKEVLKTLGLKDKKILLGLLTGVSEISHLEVQRDMEKLKKAYDFYGPDSATYFKERSLFLEKHYHHGNVELDLTIPRWGERPADVDDLVKNFTPHSFHHSGVDKILLEIPPFKRSIVTHFLKYCHAFVRRREELRTLSTRAYFLMRRALLEFGKRTGLESDIFMLDVKEWSQILNQKTRVISSELASTIEKRKVFYQGYRHFVPPHEFGGKIKERKKIKLGEKTYRGLGCSAGTIQGVARVIKNLDEAYKLQTGEILVTKFTDPGWTPVLARASAVVTEVGGLLSHAAVIGREYGIPAVLNLEGATEVISDGETIRVNGETGEVEIL